MLKDRVRKTVSEELRTDRPLQGRLSQRKTRCIVHVLDLHHALWKLGLREGRESETSSCFWDATR